MRVKKLECLRLYCGYLGGERVKKEWRTAIDLFESLSGRRKQSMVLIGDQWKPFQRGSDAKTENTKNMYTLVAT